MFTGIIKEMATVQTLTKIPDGGAHLSLLFPLSFTQNLETGASIAINGTCLTAVTISQKGEKVEVTFDLLEETLKRTNLGDLKPLECVNAERSARFGDEIGGHLLSGHIYGTVVIKEKKDFSHHSEVTFQVHPNWMKYFFEKGYVALDGVSLTIVNIDPQGFFSVHLIPETLKRTVFGIKKPQDTINLEIDSQTKTLVDTIEAMNISHRCVPILSD